MSTDSDVARVLAASSSVAWTLGTKEAAKRLAKQVKILEEELSELRWRMEGLEK
jgi:hypothetical protein